MRDDTSRLQPCLCGDTDCPWCGDGGEAEDRDAAYDQAMADDQRKQAAREQWDCMLASAGRNPNYYIAQHARERHGEGAAQYGETWQGRDNIRECLEELADAMNYLLYAHHQRLWRWEVPSDA